MPLLDIQKLCKSFQEPSGKKKIQIINDLSLSIESGESVAIMGKSGSGKSTLLNLIAGLDKPDSGTLLVAKHDVAALSAKESATFRVQSIGLVFQLHHLFPQCTVLENVLLPAMAEDAPLPAATAKDHALDLLKRVGLEQRANHRPSQLSGGEAQRCAIARALVNKPAILLADEPTGSLDESSAGAVMDLLMSINQEEGQTLLMVTHAKDWAHKMSRQEHLHQGKLAE